MNERLKALRNALGLSQKEFSQKISVGYSTLAMFETGDREMKDIHISQICHAFNVSETWLRTGSGDMFTTSDSTLVTQLVREYNLDTLDQAIVEAYIQLPAEYRNGLKAYLSSLMVKFQAVENADALEDEPVDNSELMEQAREMVARAEELRHQPPADHITKKNA